MHAHRVPPVLATVSCCLAWLAARRGRREGGAAAHAKGTGGTHARDRLSLPPMVCRSSCCPCMDKWYTDARSGFAGHSPYQGPQVLCFQPRSSNMLGFPSALALPSPRYNCQRMPALRCLTFVCCICVGSSKRVRTWDSLAHTQSPHCTRRLTLPFPAPPPVAVATGERVGSPRCMRARVLCSVKRGCMCVRAFSCEHLLHLRPRGEAEVERTARTVVCIFVFFSMCNYKNTITAYRSVIQQVGNRMYMPCCHL